MRLLKKLTKISEEEHEIDEKRGEFLIYSYVSKHPDNWMSIDKDEEPDMYWFVKKNKKELRKLGFRVRVDLLGLLLFEKSYTLSWGGKKL